MEDLAADDAGRATLHLLAKGAHLSPKLRLLLLDALENEDRSDHPRDPTARISDIARAATEWIGADPGDRARALVELLELSDALPPPPGGKTAAPSLPGKVTSIGERLEAAGIGHSVGGAIALGYYGVPRATNDIDVNVFLPPDGWPLVRDALSPLGVDCAIDLSPDREGIIQMRWGHNPIDLFFSCDELHDAMPQGVRRLPFGEATIPVPAPEHLVVRKALLDRPKDWLDIEQILVATEPLDLAEIEGWLERMAGDSDRRLGNLREIYERLSLDGAS